LLIIIFAFQILADHQIGLAQITYTHCIFTLYDSETKIFLHIFLIILLLYILFLLQSFIIKIALRACIRMLLVIIITNFHLINNLNLWLYYFRILLSENSFLCSTRIWTLITLLILYANCILIETNWQISWWCLI
jgi:hypothetical protein